MYLPKIKGLKCENKYKKGEKTTKINFIDEEVEKDADCIDDSPAGTESRRDRIVAEVNILLKKMSTEVKKFLENLDQDSHEKSDKYIPGLDIKNYLRNKYKINV